MAVTGLLTVACADEPDRNTLAQAIINATLSDPETSVTPDEALCIADELLASNLSDTTLAGLAEDFANPMVLETEVNRIEPVVEAAALTCR